MTVTFQPIAEFGIAPAAELADRGFSDYLVPIRITVAGLLGMVRQDSVDLAASRVVIAGERPVGVALIARRGWTSRLAAMAIVPEARGRGVGDACVRALLAEAAARDERTMTLEVIEQNERAVRLYERCGFRRLRRLVGHAGRPVAAAIDPALRPADIAGVARDLIAHGPADLPWQLSGETLAQAGPPAVAYRRGDAAIILTDPAAATVAIRGLVTAPHARRRGLASALIGAVAARHPDRAWRVPAIWPEELSGLFTRAGLDREPLSQLQMAIDLAAPA